MALAHTRVSPGAAGARAWDDGAVAAPTVLIVDDHADFRAFAMNPSALLAAFARPG